MTSSRCCRNVQDREDKMLSDLDLGTDVTPEEGERKTDQNANIEDDDLFLGAEGSIFTLDYVTQSLLFPTNHLPFHPSCSETH